MRKGVFPLWIPLKKGLSLLSYHLCNYTIDKNVNKMVAYRKSYEKETLCGGWIPWRTCTKTYYNEEYHPVTVPESMNLTDCCNGYEQVGLYCALSLNSSSAFASRPGACPTKEAEVLNISCTLDLDCPEHKKCCETSKGTGCSEPVSEEQTVPRYWYDVSVLVKMDFDELKRVDPKLLNHSRLLHSMITGALWPLDASVYHIHTAQAEPYTETLVSRVLIGLQELVPLANVSSLLKDIVMRVYEVIDIVVQDATDSGPDSLNILFKIRNYSISATNSTSASQELSRPVDSKCLIAIADAPAIRNHRIFSVTSSSFEVAWSVNSTRNHSFNIEIYKGKELVQQMETNDTKLDVFNLEAGIMYTVNVSAEDCGKKTVSSRKVKTDALVFGLTIRILNYNFTDQLLNTSSIEYQAFSSILMTEIRKSLPSNMSALYQMGKLKVQIDSLRAGSIVVKLKIIVEDSLFPKDLSAFEPMISSLFNSPAFLVDQNSSRVEDWNECASRAENDCCMYAECINILGSYMCRCKTTTDANPSRPGRNCEGDIVDPVTEMVPAFEANATEGLPGTGSTPLAMSEVRAVTSFTSKSTETIILPSNGTQESSTLPPDKTLSASQRMTTSGYVRNNYSQSTSETPAPVTKKWNNVTTTGYVKNNNTLNTSETPAPVTKMWNNVTTTGYVRNNNTLSTSETPAPVTKKWNNVTTTGYVKNNNTLSTSETPAPVTKKWNNITTTGYVKNNNTLSTSEAPALVTKKWDNVTSPNENLVEERSTTQERHNSSMSMFPGVSNITVYPFVRNGSEVETSTPSLITERSSQQNATSALNVTQHPTFYVLNHTLDKEMGKDNRSWAEKNPPTTLPSLSGGYTVVTPAPDCGVRFPASNIIFSNVTSTSFQVTWTTKVTLNASFHFLLLNGKELIQVLKTQSPNLTISGLEPGILYTVEIGTEVCGNKSKPVQHKVKTAAQILSGTVRISNLNYSSGFNNTSSEEYQNFTQLFLTEVHTSLPLNILPKMDAGLIKMLITSVTNGSVVVSFNLLIPEDMDANNVSSSFLEAFHHSRHFMIDNSSLSIHDYDECEREETDCSSDASCSNTYGSYECSCKEGFVNANAERPGRNCEALSPNPDAGGTQTKDLSSTVLPLTHPYTSNHVPSPAGEDSSVPQTRSLENATTSTIFSNASTELMLNVQVSPLPPSKPPQGFLIKKAVRVLCEIEKIVITIQKDFLKQESIPESSLYLGRPHCNVSSSNSSHVILRTGWNECGTEVQTNTTHTIVKSVLRNDLLSSRVIRHLKVVSPILCVFQNDLLTSSGYTPEGVYTIFEDLHGSGRFLTEMQLFIGNAPIPKNFTISASDDLMIEVGIQRHDSNLKVVVSECWATPTNNSKDPLSFPFIDGSCPVPNAHTTMISNGISNKAQFKLKIFSFVNDSVVYLHCKIHVCLEIPRSTCKTNCNGFRLMRTGETIAMPNASWGPLRKSSDEEKRGLGAGYTVLIVIGVFAFILAITGLLVFRHQHKAGAYNFKIKSDNFNYQVFYD
ncbi:uromodulin-like 1 [Lacerta agilis]|uniref:uromodulin-like 1 n=1 Tax=Lacerta agilis TaxID=80427 RepID=UPI001419271E|nr:uromodulin-like 1 [Lacerta agilis]